MGLKDALARLTGTQSPRLAHPDSAAPTAQVEKLEIHTADSLIIVVTNQPGAEVLREAARSRESATLVSPTATAHFPAAKKDACLLYTSPSPRDQRGSRMPSSA